MQLPSLITPLASSLVWYLSLETTRTKLQSMQLPSGQAVVAGGDDDGDDDGEEVEVELEPLDFPPEGVSAPASVVPATAPAGGGGPEGGPAAGSTSSGGRGRASGSTILRRIGRSKPSTTEA